MEPWGVPCQLPMLDDSCAAAGEQREGDSAWEEQKHALTVSCAASGASCKHCLVPISGCLLLDACHFAPWCLQVGSCHPLACTCLPPLCTPLQVSEKKAKQWCSAKGGIPHFDTSAKARAADLWRLLPVLCVAPNEMRYSGVRWR